MQWSSMICNVMTENNQLEEVADDQIIGTAFRYSLLGIIVIALVGTLIWWISRPKEKADTIVETVLENPVQGEESAQAPTVSFREVSEESGVVFTHFNGAYGERMLPETMGSGVAVIDVNNDGHQDLFFVNGTRWPWRPALDSPVFQALFVNRGDGTFDDMTESFGLDIEVYGTGVAAGDVNGDGYVDLFIAAVGEDRLLLNQEGAGFVAGGSGVSGSPDNWSTSAAFFDYDRDGDLDLFVCRYVQWSREIDLDVDYQLTGIGRAYGPPANYQGTLSLLLQNDGSGVFQDVSQASGIHVKNPATNAPMGKALAVHPRDVDDDGWIDLIVANDTTQNFLFRNLEGQGFEEVGADSGIAFDNRGSATGAMGVDAVLQDKNTSLAIAIGNFANEMTSFYVSPVGSLLFSDEAVVSGIGPDSRQALSFGLFFFDYDLDGRLDFLQTNGHVENDINQVQPSQHYEQATQLFWNCGDACPRAYVSTGNLADLSRPVVGRGAAYGDFDSDGDLDVVITQVGREALVLRNEQDLANNYLRVKLIGSGANTGALGASVKARFDGKTLERRVMPARSYLSQVELPLTFGLGKSVVDELIIQWPDGSQQTIQTPGVNQTLVIQQP